ncbi:DUF1983 domain-containing protein, partial [Salmonella enterica]|uniref:DUF1983 domain-containing protein n=1 Tax=Salmonella enterica TaxID=28901 RepID=UPI00156BCF29
MLKKIDLTEDNASKLQQFSKEWQDANDKWNAMWGVKIEQTKDGKYYVAGLGLSMEDMPDGKISQFLVAADRIAYINPANGNETPGFVMQGVSIRATNDERSTSTRYTDSATYQIGKTITVMANCE